MAELSNTTYNTKTARNDGWIYIILLIASFMWVSVYPVISDLVTTYWLGSGNILNTSSMVFSDAVLRIVISALVSWLVFEAISFLYRFWLSGNIYSYIVPKTKLVNESRLFFIYRNVIYGLIVNLCFFVPYLYAYIEFLNLVITMLMALVFVYHLNKVYSEPIIGHFVFKCFIYPVFIYEIISIILQVWGVLL